MVWWNSLPQLRERAQWQPGAGRALQQRAARRPTKEDPAAPWMLALTSPAIAEHATGRIWAGHALIITYLWSSFFTIVKMVAIATVSPVSSNASMR
jgi:hypothetical protein